MEILSTPCACGCGEIVQHTKLPPSMLKARGSKRFVAGHQNKGRKHSAEHIAKTKHPGASNGRWAGGRVLTKEGYVLIKMPDHPDSRSTGYILEHRLVAEKMIGRRLTRKDLVHHRNGKKDDNRPENLEVLEHAEHQHVERKGKRFKYGTRIKKECRQCGTVMLLQPSRAKHRRHFCSRPCWKTYFQTGGTLAALSV